MRTPISVTAAVLAALTMACGGAPEEPAEEVDAGPAGEAAGAGRIVRAETDVEGRAAQQHEGPRGRAGRGPVRPRGLDQATQVALAWHPLESSTERDRVSRSQSRAAPAGSSQPRSSPPGFVSV